MRHTTLEGNLYEGRTIVYSLILLGKVKESGGGENEGVV